MKKIFTLIAVAMMALGANAQMISFTELAAKGSLNGKEFTAGDFKLTITDTDASGKIAIDANNAYFGTAEKQIKLTHRLKSGGKSSSKNNLTLTVPSAGVVKLYARTGSNDATDRNVVFTQNEQELFNEVMLESNALKVKGLDADDPNNETNVYPIYSVAVKAGTVAVTYPVNSINFYGFEFVGGDAKVNSVKADAAKVATYNLAGQKIKAKKGVVIKNGKKVIKK